MTDKFWRKGRKKERKIKRNRRKEKRRRRSSLNQNIRKHL
jgi:hypothetical protein